jgi:transaldolase
MNNPLKKIPQSGQSIWLDYIRRGILEPGGELQRMIEEDDLRGVTSNPAIFEEAIARSNDYQEAIRLLAQSDKSAQQMLEVITVEDVRRAADLFLPVYEKTKGLDGYVSLEVSPWLAHNTDGTIKEARSLWRILDRPNVMIKIPGTKECLPAIQQLISEGININVTLLFSLHRYYEVALAYITGLEHRQKKGLPIVNVASVASFFLSRIDSMVDPLLDKVIEKGGPGGETAQQLLGEVAITSAKAAYQMYKEIFSTEHFQLLASKGTRTQRLLWASTSTKNPQHSDVKYVEALIGPDTVNTLPLETLKAFRDHGNPAPRLEQGIEEAQQVLSKLGDIGIDLNAVTTKLEQEGLEKFIKPYSSLIKVLEEKRSQAVAAS